MKYLATTLGVLCLLAFQACGGGGGSAPADAAHNPTLAALYGSASSGVALHHSAAATEVDFSGVSEPRYLKLSLPQGVSAQNISWTAQSASALTLAVPVAGGVEVAVVPVGGATVSVSLQLQTAAGSTSPAAPGPVSVAGLKASGAGSGNAKLSWTQDVPADYDFDGQVTIADLKPLAGGWHAAVDRSSANAAQSPLYWLDGNTDGTIDQSDATVIKTNLGLSVAGYRVYHDGIEVTGSGPGGALVSESAGVKQTGLPLAFSVTTPGVSSDSWRVDPVDSAGVSLGDATSGGGTLNLSVDLSGAALSGVTKFGTRVIDPIEVNDSVSLPLPTIIAGSTATVTAVPKGKVLLANIIYKPTVSLSGSRLTASSVGTSQSTDGSVTTSVAFEIPAGHNTVDISAKITLVANPAGGYFVRLQTTSAADGGASTTSLAELDYKTGEVRRDTNGNSSLDDEFAFHDSDRDCVSDPLLQQARDSRFPTQGAGAVAISGTVNTIAVGQGTVGLTGVTALDGTAGIPATLSLHFAENSRLGFGAGAPQIDVGDKLQATLFTKVEPGGARDYWAEALHPLGSGGGGFPGAVQAAKQANGSMLVSWQLNAAFSGYRVARYSSSQTPQGPGGWYDFCAPDMEQDYSIDLGAAVSSYTDSSTESGHAYTYDVYGLSAGGPPVFLGMGGDYPPPPPHDGGGGDGGGGDGGDGH